MHSSTKTGGNRCFVKLVTLAYNGSDEEISGSNVWDIMFIILLNNNVTNSADHFMQPAEHCSKGKLLNQTQ